MIDERKRQVVQELTSIQAEMLDLLATAERLLHTEFDGIIYNRAKSYWLAHAKMALTKEHGYLGRSMCDLTDTISECEESLLGGDEGDNAYDPTDDMTPEDRESYEAHNAAIDAERPDYGPDDIGLVPPGIGVPVKE